MRWPARQNAVDTLTESEQWLLALPIGNGESGFGEDLDDVAGGPNRSPQVIPPEGTLQLVGTIDTFDSVELAERLGIVLNDELFAPWDGLPVLIADQVDTFDPDAEPTADSESDSE